MPALPLDITTRFISTACSRSRELRANRNVVPIIGARKFSQLEDNLKCVEWHLNTKQLKRLDEVSAIEDALAESAVAREA